MPSAATADALVLGAGIIGISVAVHLQKRGRATVLVDRRGAAEETSFGNAGLVQRAQAVVSAAGDQARVDVCMHRDDGGCVQLLVAGR